MDGQISGHFRSRGHNEINEDSYDDVGDQYEGRNSQSEHLARTYEETSANGALGRSSVHVKIRDLVG